MVKDAWNCIYGKDSHMNLAGKILIGIPAAPFVVGFVLAWELLDLLFSKKRGEKGEG